MSVYLKTKDHFYTQESFELQYIPEYDMLKTNPIPQNLDDYYNHTEYISHTDQNKTFIDKIYKWIKTYSLKRKVNLINNLNCKSKNILDLGAGTGDFLKVAQSHGWSIYGVEPSKLAKEKAHKKNVTLYNKLNELPKQKFDVITLWHVLEHIPTLEQTIIEIKAKLENEGYLIIAVPNYKSYDAKYYKQYWAAYDTPRHLWHFSKQSIRILFEDIGMKVLNIKPMLFDSFYVSLLSEKYKKGKTNYIMAFLIGLMSNIVGLFTIEYSSHIYILKNNKN